MEPVVIGDATLYLGDCIEVMAGMQSNSVDAIVTDPPYLISFMQRAFDSQHKSLPGNNEGQQMQAWHGRWVKEAYRVLKPGGYLLAFGGSRTVHRLMSALEDEGFDLHPVIGWVFGCLDEQTEVATKSGVKPYHKTILGEDVLCYNPDSGEYSYQPILEILEYEYEDTAYRLIGDFGEQIVSRNHRVIVERNGREVFEFAEELAETVHIPVLENLPDLQQALYDNQAKRFKKTNMQSDLRKWTAFKEQNGEACFTNSRKESHDCAMPGMWKGSDQAELMDEETKRPGNLRNGVSGQMAIQDPGTAGCYERTCSVRAFGMDRGIVQELRRENERGEKSGMERRGDLSESQGIVCKTVYQVRSLSDELNQYGEERRVCDGTQTQCCVADQSTVNQNRSSPSYRPRCNEQSPVEPDAFCHKPRPQTIRGWRGHRSVVVRVEPFHYVGKVWCLRVATGSFVAVRNGVAFPTGNSGFPKATNLSKQFDKDLGLEREVIGENKFALVNGKENLNCYGKASRPNETNPASPEAAQWEGWFYGRQSLKPAMEPICHAQKQPEGRMVDNVRKWGTGAINVGACRVAINPDIDDPRLGGKGSWDTKSAAKNVYGEYAGTMVGSSELGRWPPHLLLDGSEEVKALFPETIKSTMGIRDPNGSMGYHGGASGLPNVISGYADNGGSAARFFPHLGISEHDLDIPPIKYCSKASKRDRDQGCEMLEAKTGSEVTNRKEGSVGLIGDNNNKGQTANPYANGAPLSRNHHISVKPCDLMRWLCRLIVPPGGVVLDPFMGSGSTLKAACLENMKCIGIEMDAEYFEIACARVAHVSPEAWVMKPAARPTANIPVQGSLL